MVYATIYININLCTKLSSVLLFGLTSISWCPLRSFHEALVVNALMTFGCMYPWMKLSKAFNTIRLNIPGMTGWYSFVLSAPSL